MSGLITIYSIFSTSFCTFVCVSLIEFTLLIITLHFISKFHFFKAFIVTCCPLFYGASPVEVHHNLFLSSSYSKRLYSQDDEEEDELEASVRAWPSQSSISSADDG